VMECGFAKLGSMQGGPAAHSLKRSNQEHFSEYPPKGAP
jgi:hypothetical protein